MLEINEDRNFVMLLLLSLPSCSSSIENKKNNNNQKWTTTYLTSQHIIFIEMSSIHFRRFTWYWFNFNTNFLTLSCWFNMLVVAFNGSYNANIEKLKEKKTNFFFFGEFEWKDIQSTYNHHIASNLYLVDKIISFHLSKR